MQRDRPEDPATVIQQLITKKRSLPQLKKIVADTFDVIPVNMAKYLSKLSKEQRLKLREANPPQILVEILDLLELSVEAEPQLVPPLPLPPGPQPPPTLVPTPPSERTCTVAELDRLRRDITDLLLQTRATPAPASHPPIAYTQEVEKWEAAHAGGYLLPLLDVWIAAALPRSSIGDPARQALLLNLTSIAKLIRQAYTAESWLSIRPMLLRMLSMEAASEIYLNGGLRFDFIQAATDILLAEGPAFWVGTPATISRKVEEYTRTTCAKFSCPQQGGRPRPRAYGRRTGADTSRDQPTKSNTTPQNQQQQRRGTRSTGP